MKCGVWGCIVLLMSAAAGCTVGGSRSVSAENDRLRREVLELKGRVAVLEGERQEMSLKLASEARARLAALPPGVAEALPVCTAIEVSADSGLRVAEGGAGLVRVRFVPRDGRGRFTQIVGQVLVDVTAVPSPEASIDSGAPMARRECSPAELRNAYRDTILGTCYEVDLVGAAPSSGEPSLLVRVRFTDAVTGATVWGTRVIPTK